LIERPETAEETGWDWATVVTLETTVFVLVGATAA
jgi:hypothetical protein